MTFRYVQRGHWVGCIREDLEEVGQVINGDLMTRIVNDGSDKNRSDKLTVISKRNINIKSIHIEDMVDIGFKYFLTLTIE